MIKNILSIIKGVVLPRWYIVCLISISIAILCFSISITRHIYLYIISGIKIEPFMVLCNICMIIFNISLFISILKVNRS